MIRNGFIESLITPEKIETDFPILKNPVEAESQRRLLLDAQTDRDSTLGKKLKLITVATKGLIEQDIANFLNDGKNNLVSEGSEALLDSAVNSTLELNSQFKGQINQLSLAVESDIKNNTRV